MPKRKAFNGEYTFLYTNTFVTPLRRITGLEIGRVFLVSQTFPPQVPDEIAVCSLTTYPDREPVDGFFPTDDFRIVRYCELNATRTHLESAK